MNYWTCISCRELNSGGMKRCHCGTEKPEYEPKVINLPPIDIGTKQRRSQKMADSPKLPEVEWRVVDQNGLRIARRFGVDRKDGE